MAGFVNGNRTNVMRVRRAVRADIKGILSVELGMHVGETKRTLRSSWESWKLYDDQAHAPSRLTASTTRMSFPA